MTNDETKVLRELRSVRDPDEGRQPAYHVRANVVHDPPRRGVLPDCASLRWKMPDMWQQELGETMNVGELIQYLDGTPYDRLCPYGLAFPRVHRGFGCMCVAFENVEQVTIGEMLKSVGAALGMKCQHSGEEYTVYEQTPVYVAERGSRGYLLDMASIMFTCGDYVSDYWARQASLPHR